MDILKIYQNYAVQTASESDKHYRPGWVNCSCPFCSGNPGNHLGYNLQNNYFYCWRCGSKTIPFTLSKLLGISYSKAKQLSKSYAGKSTSYKKIKVKRFKFKLPDGLLKISKNLYCKKYMNKRGFTDKQIKILEHKFDIFCTGQISIFDKLDLSYRLIAPIYFDNKIVSWQSRDLTGNSTLKYITCPKNREEKDHKTILYNEKNKKTVVVLVEGIFDVWKVYLAGFHSISCFGVSYTYNQLQLLLKYKKVIIFFDPDKGGQTAAKKLQNQLIFAGIEAFIAKTKSKKDAGDMIIKEIQQILKPYFKEK